MPTFTDVDEAFLGTLTVDEMYQGDTLVWPTGAWGPGERMLDPAVVPTNTYSGDYTTAVRFTVVADGRITHLCNRNYDTSGLARFQLYDDTSRALLADMPAPVFYGQQDVPLPTPVPVSAGKTYVLTFYARWPPTENYPVTTYPFSDTIPVSLSPNLIDMVGIYAPGDAYPYAGGNQYYWLDVIYQASAGPPPFSPLDIGGLFAWFDATQVAGTDGGAVAMWQDSSSSGYQAVPNPATPPPVYRMAGINGHPALHFGASGLTEMMFTPSKVIGDRTIFEVFRTITPAFGGNHTQQVQEGYPHMQTYGPSPGTIRTYTTPELDSGVSWSDLPQLFTAWCSTSPAQQWLEVDGVQRTSGWNPASSGSRFGIGGWSAGSYGSNMMFGELLIYERCLTPTERTDVLAYLHTKWSIP